MKHSTWLTKNGFQRVGHFALADGNFLLEFSEEFENTPAVYVFCHAEKVMYVGSAEKPKFRIAAYQSRLVRGLSSRSRLVMYELAETLKSGMVDIYLHPIRVSFSFVDGLPVDMLLGVESALIHVFDAPWNIRGKTRILIDEPTSEMQAALVKLKRQIGVA